MTMGLNVDLPGNFHLCTRQTAITVRIAHFQRQFLKCPASSSHGGGFTAPFTLVKQGGVIILDRQDAAWFTRNDKFARRGPWKESLDVVTRRGRRLMEHAIG